MLLDEYSRRIISEKDVINLLYTNPAADLSNVYLDNVELHNAAIDLNYNEFNKLHTLPKIDLTTADWHKKNQTHWLMPDEYKNFDIAAWVLNECNSNEVELQRCGQELLEYATRDLLPLLQYLKYLVDTMRKNNIVWGVGRGSSTASFVLYKIGIHKINSIEYDLPLEEFFKELKGN
jgi:DNA polymerase III alpha subunit